MKDIQLKYRNTEARKVSVAVGEITPADIADKILVTAIPKDSAILNLIVVKDNITEAESSFTVQVGESDTEILFDGTMMTHTASLTPSKISKQDIGVVAEGVPPFTTGRYIIMVEYIRYDIITGDRVRAVSEDSIADD